MDDAKHAQSSIEICPMTSPPKLHIAFNLLHKTLEYNRTNLKKQIKALPLIKFKSKSKASKLHVHFP